MKVSFIAALTPGFVIGHNNDLPWPRIRADMRYFRETTMGKPIIMGRRNYESIGRPLPKRTNIILTRNKDFAAEGCLIAHDAEQALRLAGDAPEVMVIGGEDIFKLYMPRVDRLYLTWVEADIKGDTYFPWFDRKQWVVVDEFHQPPGEDTPFHLVYQTLDRRH